MKIFLLLKKEPLEAFLCLYYHGYRQNNQIPLYINVTSLLEQASDRSQAKHLHLFFLSELLKGFRALKKLESLLGNKRLSFQILSGQWCSLTGLGSFTE